MVELTRGSLAASEVKVRVCWWWKCWRKLIRKIPVAGPVYFTDLTFTILPGYRRLRATVVTRAASEPRVAKWRTLKYEEE